ncbi:phenylalanyl-tRNA synthetase beta subunit [Dokdonia sp. Hel_I_63]|uniref:phenylalanine--tRNA ligase subunit beta n=1 Tax=unclassified Dokdonia TaxID=2615033 RepID=UPI00020A7547|nr:MULTISPECIES: phenylalanine--tRNA ligase subunit beta [unclassified Dokdonia]AEE20878.1 phenylalanyl-tRNA synthetase, beta subunit [Dokdonia sp. 4H-3-7-5]TVZ22875.1 phenylalanyl-tRNA synthetase beta subunit [Dokdonia sp. Hel_I_63]
MKISYNWLKQFIDIDWSAEKTGNLLTDLGLEIEGIDTYQSVKGGLEGIVIGHVLTCVQHENADKLKITTVDIGADKPVQIVCGAPNVAAGQKVPVATIGTTLYTEEGEAWKIKKGKIRGEESHGMICAEDELGLGKSHDGIMILNEDLIPGTPAAEVFEIENDQVFEIGLTPNRADAMSHWGVARDLKAGLLQQGVNKGLITPSTSSFKIEKRLHKIDVQVLDAEKAPRYAGVVISDLKVSESPEWLKHRLKAIGLSPINNIVDATNYVLHDLGQPLHAFDLNKIAGDKIEVRTVEAGTKFTTLDGVERELHEDDLMICDAEKPMCIAGVFGGAHSGVTENTSAIFLESAYFNPVAVRKTAKRHGLNTDASFRFERGIDPNIAEYALTRAALLIMEIAGGEITSEIVDIYPKKIEDQQVFLNFDNATKLIGEELPKEVIKGILMSLDIKINNVTESGIGMTIPAFRNDVTREADVIEEILRVYGYNNITFGKKLNATVSSSSKFDDHKVSDVIGNQLAAQGFYEMMANSLTTPAYTALSENLKEEHQVEMLNPLGKELSVMRQSMLFSGLEAISYNVNRRRGNIKLFEFGKTYHNYTEERKEDKHLALFVTGSRTEESWTNPTTPTNFYYLKGVVSAVLEKLGITRVRSSAVKNDIFSEAVGLSLGKQQVVSYGIVKKSILKKFDLSQDVYYADFNWDAILEIAARNNVKFKDIPKYPSVRRDFALLLDANVQFEDITTIAKQTEKQLLKDVNLFDVYEGKNLPEGKKSYAVSFLLQDENKTLTDKQIDKTMNKLQQRFEKELGATLR